MSEMDIEQIRAWRKEHESDLSPEAQQRIDWLIGAAETLADKLIEAGKIIAKEQGLFARMEKCAKTANNQCYEIGRAAAMAGYILNEANKALRKDLEKAQKNLEMLHGVKFSDRNYHALKSRAEMAEAKLASTTMPFTLPAIKLPPIVCLCGSTRFMETFFAVGWNLTLKGEIVLSVGVCKHADDHGAEALGQDVVDKLDELHLRKIDLADYVFILNVDGYIGESTQKEIDYAMEKGKPVVYLEPINIGEK